jgi:hypothetical protein
MTLDWTLVTRNLVMVPNTGMAAAAHAERNGYHGSTALFLHLVDKASTGGQPEYDELAGFLTWVFGIAEIGIDERIVAMQRLAEYELPTALSTTLQAALVPPEPEPESEPG